MATSKKVPATVDRDNGTFGLLANGSCGPWEIAIDETTSGPDRWFAQIEGPFVSLYFEIPSPDLAGKLLPFLEGRPQGQPVSSSDLAVTLVLGRADQTPVTLVRDDEYLDRCFLVIGPEARPVVRLTLAGADLTNLSGALRQVAEDLQEE
jgi:hypothetical protein